VTKIDINFADVVRFGSKYDTAAADVRCGTKLMGTEPWTFRKTWTF